jgi:diacylglycerol kinase family enzyme
LEAALALCGFKLVVGIADEQAPLAVQWKWALSTEATLFFVAGGDGTLRDAAGRLAGTGRVLAPLPGGTMNRFVARLGLPDDPLAAIAAHCASSVREVGLADVNGEPFLHECVVGRVTWLMRLRERGRGTGWHGWLQLLRGLVREALRPALPRRLAVRMGPRHRLRAHTVVVTAPVAGDAALLCLKAAPRRDARVRLRQAWRWFRGRLADDPDIVLRHSRRLAVYATARSVRLSLDGEARVAAVPLRFRLTNNALAVLAPAMANAG